VFEVLNEDNFLMYAMKCYDNNSATLEEFEEDLKRLSYLRRLLHRYHVDDVLRERLILNHLIILFNVFGIEGGLKMTFFKIDQAYWPYLKTFLIFLNYLDDSAIENIPIDYDIKQALMRI